MDILLIDPPYRGLKGMSISTGYNVGLTSLAAYLRRGGIDASIVSGDLLVDVKSSLERVLLPGVSPTARKYAAGQRKYQVSVGDEGNPVWQRLADAIEDARPAAVGIQYLTPSQHSVTRVARLVKNIDRDIKVIAGSFHPTLRAEDVMKNEDIDFVVRGEGEIPLLSLLNELDKDSPQLEKVPGIHYRDSDGQVRFTAAAPPVADLDGLPFPARDAVANCDYDIYRGHSVTSSRGCPYTCTFCSDRSLWGGKVRRRSVDNVIGEIRHLKENYNVKYIDLVDGTFTYDRKYLEAFCNALINENNDTEWRCTARYDNLDKAILELMKRSGCGGLYIGLESGSNRVLESINKHTSVDQIKEVSRMIRHSGVPVETSVLLGLPDEGREDIEATLKLMQEIHTDIFDVNSYIPLPGTILYDNLSEDEKNGLDWGKVGFKSFDNYFVKNMSYDEFEGYLERAYDIANRVRSRTIARFAGKKIVGAITGIFGK